MNTLRMLALVAAVLITAGLFRVVGNGNTLEQHAAGGTSAHLRATTD